MGFWSTTLVIYVLIGTRWETIVFVFEARHASSNSWNRKCVIAECLHSVSGLAIVIVGTTLRSSLSWEIISLYSHVTVPYFLEIILIRWFGLITKSHVTLSTSGKKQLFCVCLDLWSPLNCFYGVGPTLSFIRFFVVSLRSIMFVTVLAVFLSIRYSVSSTKTTTSFFSRENQLNVLMSLLYFQSIGRRSLGTVEDCAYSVTRWRRLRDCTSTAPI